MWGGGTAYIFPDILCQRSIRNCYNNSPAVYLRGRRFGLLTILDEGGQKWLSTSESVGSRDKQGNIVKTELKEYVMCITSFSAMGYPTMWSLVAEIETKGEKAMEEIKKRKYRIRKLTPRECFRLMGVRDPEIDKIQAAGISDAQQYKLAGNSIVVDVMAKIFANLFKGERQEKTLFDL